MEVGSLLIKLTIWVALAGYFAGVVLMLLGSDFRRAARIAWTFGCAVFLAHVFCAFNYYYHWSHRVAYFETGKQTAEVVGENWGVGVYVGYTFTLLWLTDVIWWWMSPQTHERRARILTAALHIFMFFIIFNGTVVFKSGMTRLVAIIFSLTLIGVWLVKRNSKNKELAEIRG